MMGRKNGYNSSCPDHVAFQNGRMGQIENSGSKDNSVLGCLNVMEMKYGVWSHGVWCELTQIDSNILMSYYLSDLTTTLAVSS